jgi:hypothetical protein
MHGTARDDQPPAEPGDSPTFPIPSTTLSLPHVVAYRGRDDDGEPSLIITDGVSAVALESGLSGPSAAMVVAARRLAAAAEQFATGIAEILPDANDPRPGRRPLNRRSVPGPRGGTR